MNDFRKNSEIFCITWCHILVPIDRFNWRIMPFPVFGSNPSIWSVNITISSIGHGPIEEIVEFFISGFWNKGLLITSSLHVSFHPTHILAQWSGTGIESLSTYFETLLLHDFSPQSCWSRPISQWLACSEGKIVEGDNFQNYCRKGQCNEVIQKSRLPKACFP